MGGGGGAGGGGGGEGGDGGEGGRGEGGGLGGMLLHPTGLLNCRRLRSTMVLDCAPQLGEGLRLYWKACEGRVVGEH